MDFLTIIKNFIPIIPAAIICAGIIVLLFSLKKTKITLDLSDQVIEKIDCLDGRMRTLGGELMSIERGINDAIKKINQLNETVKNIDEIIERLYCIKCKKLCLHHD